MLVKVADEPAQIVFELAVAVTDKAGPTVMVIVSVFVHPTPLSPVAVYVVVTVGETTVVEPVNAPGFQV